MRHFLQGGTALCGPYQCARWCTSFELLRKRNLLLDPSADYGEHRIVGISIARVWRQQLSVQIVQSFAPLGLPL